MDVIKRTFTAIHNWVVHIPWNRVRIVSRDAVLLVMTMPYYIPAFIIGALLGYIKLAAGAAVVGFKHGFRSIHG